MYSLGSSRETEPNMHDNLSIYSEIRKSHKVVSMVDSLSMMFTRNTMFSHDFQHPRLPSYFPPLFLPVPTSEDPLFYVNLMYSFSSGPFFPNFLENLSHSVF